ncbi:hypothetical protein [Streptomyces sp. NPDC091259]|uniref:D-alanyl-D-alanine carboxypeptidase n=1 Tax=Streptomyces sp. NPDC091259 TaxID=3365976 RepID=UPI003828A74C
MAGESPDKSVDEGASGTAESAAPSAERDPRLSVLRPRDAGSGDRDALKEAVAAWVATSSSDGSTDSGSDSDSGSRSAASGAPGDREPAAPVDAKSGSASAQDEPERASGADGRDSAKVSRPAESGKTAFGVSKPASASDAAADAASGAASRGDGADSVDRRSAESEGEESKVEESKGAASAKPSAPADQRTTAFGVVKPGSGSPTGSSPAKASDEAASEKEPAAPEKPAPGPDSERTAVFRTLGAGRASGADGRDSAKVSRPAESGKTAFGVSKPASASDPAADAASGAASRGDGADSADRRSAESEGEESKVEESKGAASAKPSAPADQRTTAFGVVKPGSASAAGDRDSAKTPPKESRTATPTTPTPGADSERTAVFRAVKQDSAAPEKKSAEQSRTAAPEKKPSGDPRTAPGKPAAADPGADSERTAVFRAVKQDSAAPEKKSAEESRTAAPEKKPSGDPRTAPGKPAAADPGADSERTAVFRAVKPGTAAPEKKPAAPGPQGRASTFVPLGGDGPKPPATAPQPTGRPTRPQPSPDAERTTQQPLPPKPPLDMLADLTNNPPPPPTPLRTALRRVKIYAPIVVLLAVVLAVVQLVRPLPAPRLAMSAKASYTFDGGAPTLPWPKEGQGFMAAAGLGTVGTFGEQKPIAIGSVAKTMTAYVILKDHPLKPKEKGAMIDVDKAAVDDGRKESEGESTVTTLKEGDKISEYDALAAIMIPSANNVARLLARWDSGGDQAAFVKKMNDAARDLGMTNTTYTDPSGLDPTTVSTAEDQVKLGLKVVEMPELLAITKLPSWTDPSGKSWRNYNDLVPYNGAVGIKTGSTTKAGGNLLFAAEKKVGKTNQLIVGAVLGQYGVPILGTAIAASKDVMIATQKALTNATVVKKGDVVGYVDDGLGGHTPVVATADVQAVGWPSLTITVKLGDGGAKLPGTAKAGTEVGVLTVGEGASQVKVPVALQRDLVAPGIGSKLTRVG